MNIFKQYQDGLSIAFQFASAFAGAVAGVGTSIGWHAAENCSAKLAEKADKPAQK